MRKRTYRTIASLTILSFMGHPLSGTDPHVVVAETVEEAENLALGKTVTYSSQWDGGGTAASALDGKLDTFYRKKKADENPNIVVDLGGLHEINEIQAVLYINQADFPMEEFTIESSSDGAKWELFGQQAENLTERAEFSFQKDAEARYIRFRQKNVPEAMNGLYELRVFGEAAETLESEKEMSVSIPREKRPVKYNTKWRSNENSGWTELPAHEDLVVPLGETITLVAEGVLPNGETVEVPEEGITLTAKPTEGGPYLKLNGNGSFTTSGYGVTRLTATITYAGRTRSFDFFVDTVDYEIVVMDTAMEIDGEAAIIGYPSIVQKGTGAPQVKVMPYFDGALTVEVSQKGKTVSTQRQEIKKFDHASLPLEVKTDQPGLYTVTVTLERKGKATHREMLYFSVVDEQTKRANETYLAYIGPDRKMVYTPDFRGNTLIDYSHAGYKGANEEVPIAADVVSADQVKTIAPVKGDNTAHIQAAIDEVGSWEMNEHGFRGVVQLKPGTYNVAGTLTMVQSGVILRGDGDDEEGGTLLFDTGGNREYLLEVGGGEAAETHVQSTITDYYVPTGSRTFTVADVSQFAVGDNVFVKRHSNERWIHEVDMDVIPEREGTVQWAPFDLNFDRTIVAIEGNTLTIDAPINHAIEQRWGGGTVVKYEDSRIENIGIEGLRVDVEVDWTSKDILTDSFGNRYSTDANQVRSFVLLRNVKNAWVQNITSHHLIYAMVNVARTSKWITVQNSNVFEMNGEISGGTRYAFNTDGQMVLIRNNHVKTARHSFTIQSRVAGPNVYLDNLAEDEQTNSEPHQRYSVGGLFDNIQGTVNIQDRGNMGTGHGWAGANYVAWNTAGYIRAEAPPTAMNYAIGAVGDAKRTEKDGHWESFGTHVRQRSLYYHQLADRLGRAVEEVDLIEPSVYADEGGTEAAREQTDGEGKLPESGIMRRIGVFGLIFVSAGAIALLLNKKKKIAN